MSKKAALIFLCCASILALLSANVAQYVFDYQPCILCFYQRKPFFVIIALSLLCLAFFKSKKAIKITYFLCIAALIINCAIAFYHVGVEHKTFRGPTVCSSEELNEIENLEELKMAFTKTKAIRCDEPSFVFLGLSMAGWNLIYCTLLIFITAISPSFFPDLSGSYKRRSNNRSAKR